MLEILFIDYLSLLLFTFPFAAWHGFSSVRIAAPAVAIYPSAFFSPPADTPRSSSAVRSSLCSFHIYYT